MGLLGEEGLDGPFTGAFHWGLGLKAAIAAALGIP